MPWGQGCVVTSPGPSPPFDGPGRHRVGTRPSPPGQSCLPNNSLTLRSLNASASPPKLLALSSSAIACRARDATMASPWPRSTSKRSGTRPCLRGHREVAGRSPTWSPPSRRGSPGLKLSLPAEERSAGHRVDFERERERADQLVTTQDRMVAELEALHSLLRSLLEAAQQAAPPVTSRTPDMARRDMARDDSLAQSMRSLLEAAQAARLEAAQQAGRPVTSRTWREVTWSERWRRLRRTG